VTDPPQISRPRLTPAPFFRLTSCLGCSTLCIPCPTALPAIDAPAAVSHIECGTRRLRLDQAIVIEHRLGITVDRLCDGTPIDF